MPLADSGARAGDADRVGNGLATAAACGWRTAKLTTACSTCFVRQLGKLRLRLFHVVFSGRHTA